MLPNRSLLVAAVCLSAFCRASLAAEITLAPSADGPLKKACQRLGDHIAEAPGQIDVQRLGEVNEWLGEEGFTINSDDGPISVSHGRFGQSEFTASQPA